MRLRSARHCHPSTPARGVLSRGARGCGRRLWPWFSEDSCSCTKFLTAQAYRALERPASGLNEGRGSVAIGTAAGIVRANLPGPGRRPGALPAYSRLTEDYPNADYPCVCPGCSRRRRQQHVDVAAAVRADLRDHVLPDSAPAAEEGERSPGAGEEYPPRRHGG